MVNITESYSVETDLKPGLKATFLMTEGKLTQYKNLNSEFWLDIGPNILWDNFKWVKKLYKALKQRKKNSKYIKGFLEDCNTANVNVTKKEARQFLKVCFKRLKTL